MKPVVFPPNRVGDAAMAVPRLRARKGRSG